MVLYSVENAFHDSEVDGYTRVMHRLKYSASGSCFALSFAFSGDCKYERIKEMTLK